MATYRQHEPLRTPAGWTDQERQLVIQLERLFDTLFNRKIQLIDMEDTLRDQITSAVPRGCTWGDLADQ